MGLRVTNRNKKKIIKKTEDNLALALYMDRSTQSRYDFMMPRCYTSHDNECDVFGIRKSGYCDEFEIKTNRADFMKDKVKLLREIAYITESSTYKHPRRAQKLPKHGLYETGDHIVNYFWFVVPEGLVTKEEVPEWAGLVYITDTGYTHPVKSPTLLHKRKVSLEFKYKMARKATYRVWNKKKLDFEDDK